MNALNSFFFFFGCSCLTLTLTFVFCVSLSMCTVDEDFLTPIAVLVTETALVSEQTSKGVNNVAVLFLVLCLCVYGLSYF